MNSNANTPYVIVCIFLSPIQGFYWSLINIFLICKILYICYLKKFSGSKPAMKTSLFSQLPTK